MKKLIKLEFDNTTKERKTEDSYSELYSHDKNNGSFEFEILNDTLTTEQVTALFKFTESNKIWKTTGTVEGNKVNVTFDTTLITRNETVICYLYFDEEQRTSDTFRFKFKVKVSEIDKMSRYEVKERFINNTVIVDRLDVVTKDELKEALKNVGGIVTEGLLTEVKAEELYAKKSEAVDNTNFELVKNRVLALELKTDKDTVYDDSELKGRISVLEAREDNNTIYDDTNVRERLTALESKPNVDVNNLVTKDELASKNYLTEHQDTSNFALKSEIPQQYNDTEVKERLTTLENKPPVDLSNYATKEELRNISGSQPLADNLVTKEELEAKHYISDVSNLATKEELQEVRNSQPTVDTSHLVTKDELESKGYLTTHQDLSEYAKKSELYNDSDLKARVEVLEQKTDKDTVYDDTPLKERVMALESKAIEGGVYDDKPIRDRLDVLEAKHDNDTIYDDTEVKHRLTELENKPAVDTSFFVTEEKLNSKGYISDISGLATKQELANAVTKDELEAKHYVTEEELNNKAYLTQQNLDNYALKSELPTPYNDSLLNERVTALEGKAIEGGAYNDTDLRNRVINLENKPPLDTSEFVTNQALESRGYIKDVSNLVTKDELEGKHYISDISNLVTKEELESKNYLTTPYNDTPLKERVEVLENKVDKDTIYNDTELRNRVEVLENKPNVDLSNYVTSEQLENKHYLTQHQELTHLATASDLEALRNITVSKSELNNKVDTTEFNSFKDNVVTKTELAEKGYISDLSNYVTKEELHEATEIDYSNIVTTDELEAKHYVTETELNNKGFLTQHQDISNLATKEEIKKFVTHEELPQPYNDTNLSNRVTALESKQDKDTIYNDTELRNRISTLESRPNIEVSTLVTKDELASKGYLTTPYNDSALVSRVSALESKPTTNQFEIHGTGMPNGVVEAEIGTTYVDKNKTNGALKWIKTTDGGNTGWEVLIGDTGWRTLNSVSRAGNSFIKIRRVNNLVTYQFGGLQWGWFGVGKRNGPGFVRHNSSGDKGAKLTYPNGIPEGFRSENSLVGPTYDDKGRPYGIWYLGGKSDLNFIQFTFNDPIPTDRDIGDIRVSAISYLTEEPWPVQLP